MDIMNPSYGKPYTDVMGMAQGLPPSAFSVLPQMADIFEHAPWSCPEVRDEAIAPLLAKIGADQTPATMTYVPSMLVGMINGPAKVAVSSAGFHDVAKACGAARHLQSADKAAAGGLQALQPYVDTTNAVDRAGVELVECLGSYRMAVEASEQYATDAEKRAEKAPVNSPCVDPASRARLRADNAQEKLSALESLAVSVQLDAQAMTSSPELASYGCFLMFHRATSTWLRVLDGEMDISVGVGIIIFCVGTGLYCAASVAGKDAAMNPERDRLLRLGLDAVVGPLGPRRRSKT